MCVCLACKPRAQVVLCPVCPGLLCSVQEWPNGKGLFLEGVKCCNSTSDHSISAQLENKRVGGSSLEPQGGLAALHMGESSETL